MNVCVSLCMCNNTKNYCSFLSLSLSLSTSSSSSLLCVSIVELYVKMKRPTKCGWMKWIAHLKICNRKEKRVTVFNVISNLYLKVQRNFCCLPPQLDWMLHALLLALHLQHINNNSNVMSIKELNWKWQFINFTTDLHVSPFGITIWPERKNEWENFYLCRCQTDR